MVVTPAWDWVGTEGELRYAVSSDGGAAVQNLPPGEYRVAISHPAAVTQEVLATVGPGASEVRVELAPGRSVEGLVRDGAGVPLALATVWLVRPGREPEILAFTDEDGRYTSHNLPEEAFELWVVDGYHKPFSTGPMTLSGANTPFLEATLEDTGFAIAGAVTDGQQRPLGGIKVSALTVAGLRVLTAVTLGDGSYRLHPLAPGSYRLVLEELGLAGAEREVTVSGGDVAVAPAVLDGPLTVHATGPFGAGSTAEASRSAPRLPLAKATRIPGTQIYDTTGIYDAVNTLLDWTPSRLGENFGRDVVDIVKWLRSEKMPPPQRLGWDTGDFRQFYISVYGNFTHSNVDKKKCPNVEKAFLEAELSERRVRENFYIWQSRHRYLNEATNNTAGMVGSEGLAKALGISLKLIAWQKDWLQSGGWLSKMINGKTLGGGDLSELEKRVIVGRVYLTLKKLIYDPVSKFSSCMYHRYATGDQAKFDAAHLELKKEIAGWYVDVADALREAGLEQLYGKEAAAKMQQGIFGKIKDVIEILADLKKFSGETTGRADQNILPAITDW